MHVVVGLNHDPSNRHTESPASTGEITWTDLAVEAIHRASSASHRLSLRAGRMPAVLDITWLAFPAVRDWPTAGRRRPVKPLSDGVQQRVDTMIEEWHRAYGLTGTRWIGSTLVEAIQSAVEMER